MFKGDFLSPFIPLHYALVFFIALITTRHDIYMYLIICLLAICFHKKASSLTIGTLLSSLTFPTLRTRLAHKKYLRNKCEINDYSTAETLSHFSLTCTLQVVVIGIPVTEEETKARGSEVRWSGSITKLVSHKYGTQSQSVIPEPIQVMSCHTLSLKEMNIFVS